MLIDVEATKLGLRVGDPELVFAHAYADPPPALARDLADLMRVHGR